MRTRDQVGLAVLICLWAWSENGPDRPILSDELQALLHGQLPELTPAELRSGLAWASGITALSAIRDYAPLTVSDELTSQIVQILGEAGEYPPALPSRTWLALVGVVSEEEALDVGVSALQQELLAIAEAAFRKGIQATDPESAGSAMSYLGDTLTRTGRYEEAITAYAEVAERFADVSHDLDGLLASLLYNKTVLLRDMPVKPSPQVGTGAKQFAGAQAGQAGALIDGRASGRDPAAAFADIAVRFAGSPDIRARRTAALAKVNESEMYLARGDATRGLQACDAFMPEFDSAEPSPWWDQVAKTLVNRAAALSLLGRSMEASEACDKVYRRFGQISDPVFQEMIARASLIQGAELAKLGQRDAAVSAYQRSARFLDEDGKIGELARRAEAASRALTIEGYLANIAEWQDNLGQPYEATDPRARLRRAVLQLNRGTALAGLDRLDEAVRAYDELISEFSNDTDPGLRRQLAMATLNRGNALRRMAQYDKAMLCYKDLEERFRDSTDIRIRLNVAGAILNQGITLLSMRDTSNAVGAFTRVDEQFGADAAPEVRDLALSALWNIVLEGTRKRDVGVIVACIDRIVERFGADPDDQLRRRVATSLMQCAGFFAELDSDSEAFNVLSTLASYDGDTDSEIRELARQGATFRFAFVQPE